MPDLGKKYTCYSCHTKFYDLGKPIPVCPKCGADQRDAEETPAAPVARGRSRTVVEEPPIEEPEFVEGESAAAGGSEEEEEEDIVVVADREEAEEDDDEEDEEY